MLNSNPIVRLSPGGVKDHSECGGPEGGAGGYGRRHFRAITAVCQIQGREGGCGLLGLRVYGMASQFPTPESHHAYENRTLYGATKTFNEGLLRSFHEMYGLNYVALRYFNVYGPRMDMHGVYTEVLIRWMERIVAEDPPLIFGPGDQTMDFIHVRDVARANILAATTDVSDEVFSVASGTETSLNQLADILLGVMGSAIRPEHRPQRSVNPVQRRLADVTRARQMLGFTASVPLNEGVRALVAWWQEERAEQAMPRVAEHRAGGIVRHNKGR